MSDLFAHFLMYCAHKLKSRHTLVRISGSGLAQVHAAEMLEATVHDMGVVQYRREARVRQRLFGLGRIIREG